MTLPIITPAFAYQRRLINLFCPLKHQFDVNVRPPFEKRHVEIYDLCDNKNYSIEFGDRLATGPTPRGLHVI